jgi:uncharacterized protein
MSSTFKCPKCPGMMRTYTRSGIQIEQCDNCRGIFLDYGELESVSRAEQQWQAAPPPPQQQGYAQPGYQQAPPPQWQQPHHGSHGYGHHRQRGFGSLFFST